VLNLVERDNLCLVLCLNKQQELVTLDEPAPQGQANHNDWWVMTEEEMHTEKMIEQKIVQTRCSGGNKI
jgi:hypothetical protein